MALDDLSDRHSLQAGVNWPTWSLDLTETSSRWDCCSTHMCIVGVAGVGVCGTPGKSRISSPSTEATAGNLAAQEAAWSPASVKVSVSGSPGHFRLQRQAAALPGGEPTVPKLYDRQASPSWRPHPSSSTLGDSLLNKINTIFIKVQPSSDGVPRQCHMSCLAMSRDIFSCLCLQIVVPV